ncbi:MAG: cytochrome c nitrite reductase small subunit [Marinilabiliales bacterium]|nr:MAG: cytochrome c nitrite reductase small subunit [Marinilabiliales bacterium]
MIKKLILFLEPPPGWKPAVVILLGVFTGIALLVFHASEAQSYISDKPETCINCHVMYPQYASWAKSSHRETATCAECHVPQDNVFSKYYVKGTDGMRHAYVFTARAEPQTIEIKQRGINVVQDNCIRCHQDLVEMTRLVEVTGRNHLEGEGHRCWDCHRDVPHGTVRSLSSAPYSLVPRLPSIMPQWLRDFLGGERE